MAGAAMRARMVALVALVALSGLLAACSGAMRLSHLDQSAFYSPDLLPYAASTGELATRIEGNPFGSGPGDAEAIAKRVHAPTYYRPVRFTTHPGPATASNYRLILVFNPKDPMPNPDDICASGGAGRGANRGGPIRVQAFFCIDRRYASTIEAFAPAATGPDDPGFIALLDQVSALIFAPTRPDIDSGPPVIRLP